MNFYEILKTKKLGRGSPDYWTQLFAEHVGGKGEWKVAGVLPLTFTAKGGTAVDWVIYGNDDNGTENLFDGTIEQGTFDTYGEPLYSTKRVRSAAILVTGSRYTITLDGARRSVCYVYDTNGNILLNETYGSWRNIPATYNINGDRLVRFGFSIDNTTDISPSDVTNIMLVKGSTAPQSYIPYQKGVGENTEIEGELPIDFRSNGDDLLGYKIYGTANGAGVQTETLWVKSSWSNSVGDSRDFFNATLLYQNGSTVVEAVGLPIYANGRYSITLNATDTNYNQIRFKHSGAMRDIYIGVIAVNFSKQDTYTITFDVLGFDASVINGIRLENIMLTKGSTAPTSYIPYGYKLPITVASGTGSKTTDIYIGDSKLGEAEYVDYGEQKIYRRILFMTHDDKHFMTKDNKDFCLRRRGYSG